MTDIFFPHDLRPNAMQFGVDDFTAVDESATTGSMQTSTLSGTRRWHLRMDFNALRQSDGSLGRFEALVATLRGRANRVWIWPSMQVQRGSFPSTELLANNSFSNGTTGWAAGSEASIAVTDKRLRVTRIANSGAGGLAYANQIVSNLTIGVQYAFRAIVDAVKGSTNAGVSLSAVAMNGSADVGTTPAYHRVASAAYATTSTFYLDNIGNLNSQAGDFYEVPWTSLTRCALVDNGQNLTVNSDTPGSGSGWTLAGLTSATSAVIGPDGTADVRALTETAATSAHQTFNTVSIPSAVADYTGSVYLKPGTRNWAYIEFSNTVTGAFQWFNLSTGALGSQSIGAGFTFVSAQCVDCGNGWKRCHFTIRKTDSSTSLLLVLGAATGDTVVSYLGSTASPALQAWRASVGASSVPIASVGTASTSTTGTGQTGNQLNLKGLPVSTQGLLLTGDIVEVAHPTFSQLLRVTSRLDSDAAGLGTLIFENALRQSPLDGGMVVVHRPMARFLLAAANLGVEYTPGIFGQASLEFIEAP